MKIGRRQKALMAFLLCTTASAKTRFFSCPVHILQTVFFYVFAVAAWSRCNLDIVTRTNIIPEEQLSLAPESCKTYLLRPKQTISGMTRALSCVYFHWLQGSGLNRDVAFNLNTPMHLANNRA